MMRVVLVVFAFMASVSVYAAGQAASGISPGGSDSCGLGWQVTDKKTMSATTTRGTTNYFVPFTFGMTTGTMGCEQHPLAANEIDAAKYAVNNYEALSIEMAQGQGEFLTAFAQTMGCSDAGAVGRLAQDNYNTISAASNGLDMYENVRQLIRQNGTACANVI